MARKTPRREYQEPAKPFARAGGKHNKRGEVPAVAKRGRLTLRQIRRAVENALRGKTFEADADA
jgi:hypothetical protein